MALPKMVEIKSPNILFLMKNLKYAKKLEMVKNRIQISKNQQKLNLNKNKRQENWSFKLTQKREKNVAEIAKTMRSKNMRKWPKKSAKNSLDLKNTNQD